MIGVNIGNMAYFDIIYITWNWDKQHVVIQQLLPGNEKDSFGPHQAVV